MKLRAPFSRVFSGAKAGEHQRQPLALGSFPNLALISSVRRPNQREHHLGCFADLFAPKTHNRNCVHNFQICKRLSDRSRFDISVVLPVQTITKELNTPPPPPQKTPHRDGGTQTKQHKISVLWNHSMDSTVKDALKSCRSGLKTRPFRVK
jgi:hypothetical protein